MIWFLVEFFINFYKIFKELIINNRWGKKLLYYLLYIIIKIFKLYWKFNLENKFLVENKWF